MAPATASKIAEDPLLDHSGCRLASFEMESILPELLIGFVQIPFESASPLDCGFYFQPVRGMRTTRGRRDA